MKRTRVPAPLFAVCLTLAIAACGPNDTDSTEAGEDRGLVPDTTATTPNAIRPTSDGSDGVSPSDGTSPSQESTAGQ